MFNHWEMIYDLLFAPRRGLRQVAQQKPLLSAVVIAGTAAASVLMLAACKYDFGAVGSIFLLAGFIGGIVRLLLMTAFWHLSAALLGGRGSVQSLLAALGYANLPFFFLAALTAVAIQSGGRLQTVILLVGVLFLAAWHIYLLLEAVAAVYGFGKAKALLTMLLPLLFVAASFVVLFVASGIMIATNGGAR